MQLHRSGDSILDRYLPGASEAAREEARENLRRLVDLVIRVNERLAGIPQGSIRPNGQSALDSESPHIEV